MTIFMTVVLSSAGMYANDLPDENETIVNTTKEIIRNMTKLRFGEVLKLSGIRTCERSRKAVSRVRIRQGRSFVH